MAKIEKFEDLLAWQASRELTKRVYEISSTEKLLKNFSLRDQMQRAAVSIMSNIAEGFERSTNKDKIHFFNMARASCGELRSLLYVCLDNQSLDANTVASVQEQAIRTGKLISGFIRSLRGHLQKL